MALAAIAMLLSAAEAHAATVHWESKSRSDFPRPVLRAAPGERNDVRVTATADVVTINDAGAPLKTSGGPCRSVDPNTVECEAHGYRLFLGDQDDRADLSAQGELVDAGPGDDVLVGSPHRDNLRGGDGRDIIDGRGGIDWIAGDAESPASDRLAGGDGDDRVIYTMHPRGVRVQLGETSSVAGAEGEHDEISSFEDVEGTSHDDVLLGDGGPNEIDDGHDGRDRIVSGGGDDDISAASASQVDAGSGNDRVWVGRAPRASVDCGTGSDVVQAPNGDAIDACERWTLNVGGLDEITLAVAPSLGSRRATLTMPCPRLEAFPGRCAGWIVIETDDRAHRLIGRGDYDFSNRRRRGNVVLPLAPRDAAALRSERGLAVRMRVAIAFHESDADLVERGRGGFHTVLRAGQR